QVSRTDRRGQGPDPGSERGQTVRRRSQSEAGGDQGGQTVEAARGVPQGPVAEQHAVRLGLGGRRPRADGARRGVAGRAHSVGKGKVSSWLGLGAGAFLRQNRKGMMCCVSQLLVTFEVAKLVSTSGPPLMLAVMVTGSRKNNFRTPSVILSLPGPPASLAVTAPVLPGARLMLAKILSAPGPPSACTFSLPLTWPK